MSPDVLDKIVDDLDTLAAMRGARWTNPIRGMISHELEPHCDACGRRLVEKLKRERSKPDVCDVINSCTCPAPKSDKREVVRKLPYPEAMQAFMDGMQEAAERRGGKIHPMWEKVLARIKKRIASGDYKSNENPASDIPVASIASGMSEEGWQ